MEVVLWLFSSACQSSSPAVEEPASPASPVLLEAQVRAAATRYLAKTFPAGWEGASCCSEQLCAHSSHLVLPSNLISLPFLPQKEHVSFISCCLLTVALHGVCFCVWWLSLYGKCEKRAASSISIQSQLVANVGMNRCYFILNTIF